MYIVNTYGIYISIYHVYNSPWRRAFHSVSPWRASVSTEQVTWPKIWIWTTWQGPFHGTIPRSTQKSWWGCPILRGKVRWADFASKCAERDIFSFVAVWKTLCREVRKKRPRWYFPIPLLNSRCCWEKDFCAEHITTDLVCIGIPIYFCHFFPVVCFSLELS